MMSLWWHNVQKYTVNENDHTRWWVQAAILWQPRWRRLSGREAGNIPVIIIITMGILMMIMIMITMMMATMNMVMVMSRYPPFHGFGATLIIRTVGPPSTTLRYCNDFSSDLFKFRKSNQYVTNLTTRRPILKTVLRFSWPTVLVLSSTCVVLKKRCLCKPTVLHLRYPPIHGWGVDTYKTQCQDELRNSSGKTQKF